MTGVPADGRGAPSRGDDDDIDELVRLRQVMFDSMEGVMDTTAGWEEPCAAVFRRRASTDGSVVAFVVDAPEARAALAACGVATVAARLPGPGQPQRPLRLRAVDGHRRALAPPGLRPGRVRARSSTGSGPRASPPIDLHATTSGEPLYRSFGFREGETIELRWRARWFTEASIAIGCWDATRVEAQMTPSAASWSSSASVEAERARTAPRGCARRGGARRSGTAAARRRSGGTAPAGGPGRAPGRRR